MVLYTSSGEAGFQTTSLACSICIVGHRKGFYWRAENGGLVNDAIEIVLPRSTAWLTTLNNRIKTEFINVLIRSASTNHRDESVMWNGMSERV